MGSLYEKPELERRRVGPSLGDLPQMGLGELWDHRSIIIVEVRKKENARFYGVATW